LSRPKQAPIIFIDELDAIGKSRLAMVLRRQRRARTNPQPVAQLRWMVLRQRVRQIVLAATNRPESLDTALLCPGRFDRQVLVDRPDLSGREAFLRSTSKVKLGPDVDLRAISYPAAGADLANLVNEAACWQLGIIVRLWRKQILLKRSSA